MGWWSSSACVLWAATVLVREAAPDRPLLAALGIHRDDHEHPVLHNLKWGQVSILILAAAGGAFVAYARDRKNLAALLLGVAAGIKGYPLVFLGWFVARGDLRFVLRAVIACLVTLVVLPAIVMGPEHALFFQRVSTNSVLGAADGVLRDFNSQYAPAVLSRFYEGAGTALRRTRSRGRSSGAERRSGSLPSLVVVAARSTSPRIAAAARDARPRPHRLLDPLLAPNELVALLRPSARRTDAPRRRVRRARPAREALAIGVLVAPSVYLSNVLGLFATEGWWFYANAGSLFFANGLVLVGCAAFVVDAHLREGAALVPRSLLTA